MAAEERDGHTVKIAEIILRKNTRGAMDLCVDWGTGILRSCPVRKDDTVSDVFERLRILSLKTR